MALKSISSMLNKKPILYLDIIRKATTSTQEPARIEKTINSVQLLGRVGADPQKKGTEEHPIAVFSLATHTNYRYESGEFMQRTEWHRIVCFKPGLRETILNYLKKGQRVHVNGRITYGEVRGEDGKPRTTTAIAADDVIFFNSQQ
ncbi:single-stranded DNA-binding protein, mitochondrial [Diorhabda carinulata]|uniref:single-stranded DNA-binding protein, mitochondrial n=1 Tax=Diorhabda sublineata TaxID=1163346 RepID=UPI0024E0F398|nr:single-stranded DNA-binding protein, mitochondrial [Diorhabda sublineata]XP_057655070.1 single-stranded DNA-binding protein, mitochondrial [Diorhabda carinulata]